MNFILDYSKWRSGRFGDYQVGEGETLLLNIQGYSCCIGQFSKQACNVKDEHLINRGSPWAVAFYNKVFIPIFTIETGVVFGSEESMKYDNSSLASKLITINDSEDISPEAKIVKIGEELKNEGHTLTVINKPELSNP